MGNSSRHDQRQSGQKAERKYKDQRIVEAQANERSEEPKQQTDHTDGREYMAPFRSPSPCRASNQCAKRPERQGKEKGRILPGESLCRRT